MKSLSKSNRSFNFPTIAILTLIFLIIVSVFNLFITSKDTRATSISDFRAGNIISDSVFYNKDTMNVQQIQAFLDRQIGTCDTWGTGIAREWGSSLNRADFARSRGWHAPPYVCLNNYHENPNTKENSYTRGGGHFAGGISAAQIIYNASQQYNINPQVLLTMLRKESAGPLTNDNWPLQSQYTYAMGWGCPDSGPGHSANCQGARAGFYNQMMTAAWQFNYYRENSNSYRYKLGWNDIQYAPDPACGTKRVNIENVATLSLYIYTPYTPNDASLRNYPGTAHCGSYGNRNFFMMFSNWFGSPTDRQWSSMKHPRVMSAKSDTHKINPNTGQPTQSIKKDTEMLMETSTSLGDQTACLRTTTDTSNDINSCIKISSLKELNPKFSNISPFGVPERWSNNSFTCKVNYRTKQLTSECFDPGTSINMLKEIEVANTKYLVTEHDFNSQNSTGFLSIRFNKDPAPVNLKNSEKEQVNHRWTCKVNMNTLKSINSKCIDIGTTIKFANKVTINGVDYLIEEQDYTNNIPESYLAARFENIEESEILHESERRQKTTQWTCKVNLATGRATNTCFSQGTPINLIQSKTINGVDYLITLHDVKNNQNTGFLSKRLFK